MSNTCEKFIEVRLPIISLDPSKKTPIDAGRYDGINVGRLSPFHFEIWHKWAVAEKAKQDAKKAVSS